MILNVCGRAMMPRCLKFLPISCMGPKHAPKDTYMIFPTHFGALLHVRLVQIWIMLIKCLETWLMYKKGPNELWIILNFNMTRVLVYFSYRKKIQGEKRHRMSFRPQTWRVHSTEPWFFLWESFRFVWSLYQNLSQIGQFFFHSLLVTISWHHAKFHEF